MYKNQIKKSFNKAVDTYDQCSQMQTYICQKLGARLKKFVNKVDVTVDFGCGTGVSTDYLIENFGYNQLIAIDIADHLLTKAKQKINNQKIIFINADFENIIFRENSIDLAFANMSYQWCTDIEQTFFNLVSQVKPGGLLAFSVPIDGTLLELNAKNKNNFVDFENIKELIIKLGCSIVDTNTEFITTEFISPLEALKSFKKVGANFVLQNNNSDRITTIRKFSHTNLTYNIAYIIAKRH